MSVCVAAYNEERHVGALLASLRNQTLAPSDVIVADDGSTDRTAEIAKAAGARVLRLRHRGPALARNAAADVASGDVLAFIDADMRCAPRYLERLVDPISEGRANGTFSREIYLANPQQRWARAYAALRWSPPDRLLPTDFRDRWDVFYAIRRDRFLAVGGYDDIGYGEDRTLARKLGELALAAPGAVCFHNHPDTPREIFENGRWVGRGAAIKSLERPWAVHSPFRVIRIAMGQIRNGRTPWVLPARVVYHTGVWIGLADSSLRPGRHWK